MKDVQKILLFSVRWHWYKNMCFLFSQKLEINFKYVLTIFIYLTLIRAAGGVYDFQNFEQV